jgi:hypothetical protein
MPCRFLTTVFLLHKTLLTCPSREVWKGCLGNPSRALADNGNILSERKIQNLKKQCIIFVMITAKSHAKTRLEQSFFLCQNHKKEQLAVLRSRSGIIFLDESGAGAASTCKKFRILYEVSEGSDITARPGAGATSK